MDNVDLFSFVKEHTLSYGGSFARRNLEMNFFFL